MTRGSLNYMLVTGAEEPKHKCGYKNLNKIIIISIVKNHFAVMEWKLCQQADRDMKCQENVGYACGGSDIVYLWLVD